MCIAVYKPKEAVLTKRTLKNCFDNNPDGAGFAYPNDEGTKIEVRRGYFGFRKFWRDYKAVQDKEKPMLIHFRIATSGCIDEENCHPWRIDEKHAFVHRFSTNLTKNQILFLIPAFLLNQF